MKPTYEELLQAAVECRNAQKTFYEARKALRDGTGSEKLKNDALNAATGAERRMDKLIEAAGITLHSSE